MTEMAPPVPDRVEPMSAWDNLAGQDEAIAVITAAVNAAHAAHRDAHDSRAMTHAWLITGPPGSGRSNVAYAFAAALLSTDDPDDRATVSAHVAARSHPDLGVLASERVIITIDEVRALVARSQFAPSLGRFRVMVIEDADRMTERTSNVLLKALEEPPEQTVWILCAPSEADLLPTIRSRVRTLRLRTPSVAQVAELLERRDGVDPHDALQAARHAQSHIGMARRLATDPDARARRERALDCVLAVHSVSSAVTAAATLLEIAGDDAAALRAERDDEERQQALHALGVESGGTVPPALRVYLRQLEDDQKRRATRTLRDGIDRILTDLLSIYRDVLIIQLGTGAPLINSERGQQLDALSAHTTSADTLAAMDAIASTRQRVARNVAPLLALEAMLVAFVRGAAQ